MIFWFLARLRSSLENLRNMAWQNSFSLSLELTRFVTPGNLSVVTRELVTFARSLQNSGSDLIMEEDLGDLFSRFRLDTNFLDQFKQTIIAETKITKVSDMIPIALQAGPGPSVQRALKEPHYMSMIIHLAMFAAGHELEPFSEALSEILMKRSEGEGQHAFVAPRTIKRLMQVCAEQTTGYRWDLIMDAIELHLGLRPFIQGHRRAAPSHHRESHPINARDRYYSLSWQQLQASLDILVALQRSYSENVMVSRQNIARIYN